jgi:aromatic ring-opening dioxygenase catalytic subunit (LigB family)
MTIVYAAAVGHAPGIVAWPDAAPADQRERVYAGMETLKQGLAAANVDGLIIFTSEHWTNFFLDHVSPFCIGRAEHFTGPVEPWMRMSPVAIPGDPALAERLLQACYDDDLDPGFAYELAFDHGTMVPLKFLTPAMDVPVVPIFINTLAPPQPSARRCAQLGRIVGDVARASNKRIGLIATGGMSHDPGETNHGAIDSAFDRRFLDDMADGRLDRLQSCSVAELAAAGAGAIELLAWIALAGALRRFKGEVVAYEPVVGWATGIGLMTLTSENA